MLQNVSQKCKEREALLITYLAVRRTVCGLHTFSYFPPTRKSPQDQCCDPYFTDEGRRAKKLSHMVTRSQTW